MKVLLPFIFSILLASCYVHRAPCPAYVVDPQMSGTYDPNQAQCGVWYEWLGEYWWSTYDKPEALECWATISNRPMYFSFNQEFNFAIRAADGYTYTFWSMATCRSWDCDVPDTLYNITAVREKLTTPL